MLQKRRFELEALEPRCLLSGGALAVAASPLLAPSTSTTTITESQIGTVQSSGSATTYDIAGTVGSILPWESGSTTPTATAVAPPSASTQQSASPTNQAQGSAQSQATTASAPTSTASSTASTAATTTSTGVSQVLGSPTTEQLTETLTAANGPPGGASTAGSISTVSVPTFTQGAGGTTVVEIGGASGPGVNPDGWDQIKVDGLAQLGGTLKIQLVNGFVPEPGQVFQVLTWGSRQGDFANWLGTAGIPGHPAYYFQPIYTEHGLALKVIDDPDIGSTAASDIQSGLNTLAHIGTLLNNVGNYATNIPLIGDKLSSFIDSGAALTHVIAEQIQGLLSAGPTAEAAVTSFIQSWDGTTVAGFHIKVDGVLGHYDATGTGPFWWDLTLEITPPAVTKALQNVLGGALDAQFSSPPSVQVNGKLTIDMGFGYDGGFFVKLDHMTAQADVTVSGLSGFPFQLVPPSGPVSLNVSNGSVTLSASITATPDASILTANLTTGPRIEMATLTNINSSVTSTSDAFNYTKTSNLDALFALSGALTGFGFNLSGTTSVHIQSNDLFTGGAPDVTVVVNGSLTVLNETLAGTFTFKKTATETDLEASGVTLNLVLGTGGSAQRVLQATNGSGQFVLLGNDLAGTASLTLTQGPNIPGMSLTGTTLNLAFNTSTGAVASIDGNPVNLPAGPYYRVSGHGVIGLTALQANLAADFVFEPKNTDLNPANGDEEVDIGVANLTFAFDNGTNPLLSVTDGSGAFVITPAGIYGKTTATASLAVPAVQLSGTFNVLLNNTNTSVTGKSVDVNGTTVVIPALPAGPYLQVQAAAAQLTVLGVTLTGDFLFESRTTNTSAKVVTVAASNVSFNLGSIANDLLNITNGSGVFIMTADGLAGRGSLSVAINVSGLTLSGTFTLALNETNAAVNQTVNIGGSPITLNLPAGPYLQVNGTGVTLGFLGVSLTGNFSIEQVTSTDNTQLVTVVASNVSFNFGTTAVTATNGSGFFVITDSGLIGQGSITVSVAALGLTHTFNWDFNNTDPPIDQIVNVDGIQRALHEPDGPFNRLSTGGPVTFSITAGGQTESVTAGLVLTLVHPDNDPTHDYVTVGVSGFGLVLGAGAVQLTVGGGTGAFVIRPSAPTKLAGQVTVSSASLNLAPSVVTLNATNLKVQFNNTGGDVAPVSVPIDDNPAHNVTIQFTGAYYHDYLAVAGGAELVLPAGFVTLGGNFAVEVSNADSNVLKIAGSDLHFDLTAGSTTVASFNHGSGEVVVSSAGVAGTGSLQFQSGLIGMSGTIGFEVNTGASLVNTTVTTPTGPATINLTNTQYLKVNVSGTLRLGSLSLPYTFYVFYDIATHEVQFWDTNSNTELVAIDQNGTITPKGPLAALSNLDFAQPGSFDFVSMLKQLGTWIDSFRSSSIFDVQIPFTGDKTLGDAFDWSQLFIDNLYSHLVSVELQSAALWKGQPVFATGAATFQLQLNSDTPKTVTVGAFTPVGPAHPTFTDADVQAAVALVNAGLTGAGLYFGPNNPNNKVEARENLAGQLVIALSDSEVAKGTKLNEVAADLQTDRLGFGPQDSDPTSVEHVAVLTSRYNTDGSGGTPGLMNVLSDLLNDGSLNGNGTVNYNAAQQVYTFDVDSTKFIPASYSFEVPFSFSQDLGPLGNVQLNGKLNISASVGFHFTLGFDFGAVDVPRVLTSSQVPVPANGRISSDAHFKIYLNDDPSNGSAVPINLTLTAASTAGDNSIDDLAAQLNTLFHTVTLSPANYKWLNASANLGDLLIAQKADTGLAISAQSSQLGIINRIVTTSASNDTFATEMGFGIQSSPDGLTFLSASNSSIKGLFIDNAHLSGSVSIIPDLAYNPSGLSGSLQFGFVNVNAPSGTFGTLDLNGNPNPIAVTLSLQDKTTNATRFYITDLMHGTSSNNILNMVDGPHLTGSFLAKLNKISVSGLGFSLPLNNPQVSIYVPDITNLNYNANPYNPVSNKEGIFITYPSLGSLQDLSSLNFSTIIQALQAIADNLSKLSAFSFLNEKLPLVDMSVNDMIGYAAKFANLIDAISNGGSQTLQDTIASLQTQIDQLFHLDPGILQISIDDGGLAGLLASTSGGVNGVTNATAIINAEGDNNGFKVSTTSLATAGSWNNSIIRVLDDPSISGATATATWDAATRSLTVRLHSGVTTASTVISAINGISGSPWTASLYTPDNGSNGNTGAGTIVTSALATRGGVNNTTASTTTIMPGGDNNNFTLTSSLPTAGDLNGSIVRIVGDSTVSGTGAQASWDAQAKVLTIKINPGQTTGSAIITAINGIGSPWTAAPTTTDNGKANSGNGTVTTLALRFNLAFLTAYANTLPFQLNLADLLNQVGAGNPGLQSFLSGVNTLIQASGSGTLTVSASAKLALDFGLDLSNGASVRPFLYDDTGVVLTARVVGTNLNFSVTLGSVAGIQIQNGSVTIDADGDPNTTPKTTPTPDNGAEFDLTLRDTDGTGRHYFDSNFFSADNINLRLLAGVSAVLPVYANLAGALLPLGSTAVDPQTGYPGNVLAFNIPDLARFFGNILADPSTAVLRFIGPNNDLSITSPAGIDDFSVQLQDNTGLGTNAHATFANNTLTIEVNSGQTTALAVQTAVQALGPGWTVTFLPNDPADPNSSTPVVNTGAGTITTDKLKMASPDFSSLLSNLDFCTILSSATGPLLDGLDTLLGKLQDGINSIVSATKLPLIGDGLAGAANFIDNFRNGLLKELRDDVQAASGDGLTAVQNAIKKAFWNSLGPGGLNLLVDVKTGNPLDVSKGYNQLDVTLDCNTGLVVKLRLAKTIDLVDTSGNPIKFDIGVPGFGLQGNINVKVALGFDLKFGFGVSPSDGFYFDSSAPASSPELQLFFKVTLPGTHFSGQLLFLQLDVADDSAAPSGFDGHFNVDLLDPNGDGKLTWAELTSSGTSIGSLFHPELGADAAVNLDLAASFGGNTAFPRVLAQFHLRWHFDVAHGAGTPQIYFDNIYLDVGSFISDFLAPILSKIQDVTKPLQPIIDVVQARIPILSDLAGHDITLLDLAQLFGLLEPSTVDFIKDVAQVITLINDIQGIGSGDILIPFGSFSLTGDNSGSMTNISPKQAPNSINLQNAIANDPDPGVSSTYQKAAAGFAGDLGNLHNFSIPVLDHPSELFNLFIGKPVRLVEWRMPQFKFTFTYVQKIPIYPPLYAQFGGSIGATINIGFGYDTFGIQQFINDPKKNPVDLLDGFYIITNDANGQRQPALTLTGEIFAGASIDLVIVEVGVRGGITATVNFYWNDNSDNDGKMRVSEIIANALEDPRCIFNIEGSISLFLEAYLKIDLFFFSIDKTWRFATITLVTFDLTCPEPVLGDMSGSVLTLNLGPRAADRLYDDTSDGPETFTVKHLDGSAGNETLLVTWAQHTQQFTGVSEVNADGGQGDDTIDLRGVLSTSHVSGGAGNDTIYLSDGPNSTADGGAGDDTITASKATTATAVVIHGGDGNDTLTAGPVAITIYGDAGNDTITGSPQGDMLFGGDGDDTITAGDGNDFVDAGNGNDQLDGGNGSDLLLGGGGDDVINAGPGDDVVDGGDSNDVVYAGAGNDILVGGNGNDNLYGDGGSDLLIGDKVTSIAGTAIPYTPANIAAVNTALTAFSVATGAIPVTGIKVQGLYGPDDGSSGNDFLVGAGGSDVLFGGNGDDFLYGGNFVANGDTATVEEDGNDFLDGGTGNDTIFGDDSMGRTGDRDTGIAIKSSVWYDQNGDHLLDNGEQGIGGVTVKLYTASQPPYLGFSPVATTTTDVDGSYKFLGLDPNNYILTFSLPAALNYTAQLTNDVAHASNDSDAAIAADATHVLGQTDPFFVGYDTTFTQASAGYTGNPAVYVSNASIAEGNVGQTSLVFTVTLSGTAFFGQTAVPVEVDYQTADGNDADPLKNAYSALGDYEAITPGQKLIFNPGETSKQITVLVNGDSIYEPNQQLRLLVNAKQLNPNNTTGGLAVNNTAGTVTLLGTILNDDPIPAISISDYNPRTATPLFTQGDFADFGDFRQKLTAHSDQVSLFVWNSFSAADQQLLTSPTATETQQTLALVSELNTLLRGPSIYTAPRFAGVTLSPQTSTLLGSSPTGDALILLNRLLLQDAYPTDLAKTIAGETEGAQATFLVTLSNPSQYSVFVDYQTDTALTSQGLPATDAAIPNGFPNANFNMTQGTLTFLPGQTRQVITVQTLANSYHEGDTQFWVNLFNSQYATITDTRGVGVIPDKDPAPSVTIVPFNPAPTSGPFTTDVIKDPSSPKFVILQVSLSAPSGLPVTITWATSPGTAVEGRGTQDPDVGDMPDYDGVPTSNTSTGDGTLVFSPGGALSQFIKVKVNPTKPYANPTDTKTFFVNLLTADNAIIAADPTAQSNHVTVVIHQTAVSPVDTGPWSVFFSSNNYDVTEPVSGSTTVDITIERTPGSSQAVAVFYTTDGTATAGLDYAPVFRQLVRFGDNELSKTIPITIYHDNLVEGDETVFLSLRNPTGGPVRAQPDTARLTIHENNASQVWIEAPKLGTMLISDRDFTNFDDFVAKLNAHTDPVSLFLWSIPAVQTALGSPPASLKLNLELALDSASVLQGPSIYTTSRFAGVTLSAVTKDWLARNPSAPGDLLELNRWLLADAYPGQIAKPFYGFSEGTVAVPTFLAHDFTVFLTAPAGPAGVNISYQTVDLTARSAAGPDQDFQALSGILHIPAGADRGTISVLVQEDSNPELNETFAVRLNGTNGPQIDPLAKAAVTTIYDDDLTPIKGVVFYDTNGNGFQDLNEPGIPGVTVNITYYQNGIAHPTSTVTLSDGSYNGNVLLGQVDLSIDGTTVHSPIPGMGGPGATYHSTTKNETQSTTYQGIVGLPAFADVGYILNATTSVVKSTAKNTGRGGTDDTIYGGPGNDDIDAGDGFDHVVGGYWYTATDANLPINNPATFNRYDADVQATTSGLPTPYGSGPIFGIRQSSLSIGGSISGVIWLDANNDGIRQASETFGQDVVVTLMDCLGNLVNSLVSHDGTYTFNHLYTPTAPASKYMVRFDLPTGYVFLGPGPDNNVTYGNLTTDVAISAATPTGTLNAGIKQGGIQPGGGSGNFQFSQPSYVVSDAIANGVLTLTIVRSDSFDARAVVVRTEDATAKAGVDYDAVSLLLQFNVGENRKTVDVPIKNTNIVFDCTNPKRFNVVLRDPTGRPLASAPVFITGPTVSDDDTIQGGGGWDIVLGDSGIIPAPTIIDPTYANLGGIIYTGGVGNDLIHGGSGPDFIDAGPGDDTIYGDSGLDQIHAGSGNDTIYIGLDNEDIHGDDGFDTIVSTRDVPFVYLTSPTPTTAILTLQVTSTGGVLNTTTLSDIEMAELFGGLPSGGNNIFIGAANNTFDITDWNGSAFIVGNGGNDTLVVNGHVDMKLKDASFFEGILYDILYGFFKDGALTLAGGGQYDLSSIEHITLNLTGGPGGNTIDASGYSRPVTFEDSDGNDTLIGGSGNDTFAFNADSPLGTMTLTGNGGTDTLDFSAGSVGVMVNLGTVASLQGVNGNLQLKLMDKLENVTGSKGGDTLTGNDLANVLIGGTGLDTLAGGAGDDTYPLNTDSQLDTKIIIENIADPGFDTLDFSGTLGQVINLNMSILNLNQTVNPHLILKLQGEGIEQVFGGALNDVIRGNSNNNVLHGGPGDDFLDGKSGDDTLDGGPGNNTLIGGPGMDTVTEQGDTNFTLTNTRLTRGTGQTETLDSIDIVHLTGGPHANVFDITGFTGTGSITGGKDPTNPLDDTLIAGADANFTLSDTSLDISINFAPIALTGIDVAVLTDGPGGHTLDAAGFSGEATLNGGDGNDTFKLGGGLTSHATVNGGGGVNTLIESFGTVTQDINFTLQTGSLLAIIDPNIAPPGSPTQRLDTFTDVQSVSLTGGLGNNIYDVSAWLAGSLTLNGVGALDVVLAQLATHGLATLTNTSLTLPGSTGSIALNSIGFGALTGTALDDTLDASAFSGRAILRGGDGNDVLKAGSGNTLLDGGPGNDRFVFRFFGVAHTDIVEAGDGEDTLDFSTFSAPIAVDLSFLNAVQSVAVGDLGLNLFSTGPEVENIVGGMAGGTLTGNSLDNSFTITGGVNAIDGATGNNTVLATADSNMTLTNTTLTIGGTNNTLANVQVAKLTGGTANVHIIDASGFSGSTTLQAGPNGDTLIGGTSTDVLISGAGNDTLRGGAGNDIYRFNVDGPQGQDTVDELPGNGLDILDFSAAKNTGVTVNLGLTAPQTVAPTLTLTLTHGDAIEAVLGTPQIDFLTGNSLANTFAGNGGADSIIGGTSGNNTVVAIGDSDFVLTNTSLTAVSANPLFTAADIRDVAGFVARLQSDSNPLTQPISQFIWSQFSPATQSTLTNTGLPLSQRQAALVTALNQLLQSGSSLFDPTRFAGVTLSAQTTALVAQSPSPDNFTRLNRLLLVDTYQGDLAVSLTNIQHATLAGGAGNNILDASAFTLGGVSLLGLDGNDLLIGGYGNDRLDGGNGNDTLYGGAGSDNLIGGAGNDVLNGAGHFDPTLGSNGNDILAGGLGNDTYVFDITAQPPTPLNPNPPPPIPLGTETIIENPGEGYADTIIGLGPAVTGVNLQTAAAQNYYDANGNLLLTLFLTNPGTVEFAFP